MPIEVLDTFEPRSYDGTDNSAGHSAGHSAPGGGGMRAGIVDAIASITEKVNEVVAALDSLPFTATVLATPTELTIDTGAITVTLNYHTVDTEADGASDDLTTITGGEVGQVIVLRPASDARTVVVKHTAAIICPYGVDISLAEDDDYVQLIKFDADTWVVLATKITAAAGGLLGSVLALTTAGNGASLIGIQDSATVITATTVEAALLEIVNRLGTRAITDPGNAGAIPVTHSGYCSMVSGAVGETRTLAAPTIIGQRLQLTLKTDGGGDVTVTCATTFNEAANNTAVFADAGDTVTLVAVEEGANLRWRGAVADGLTLTTV